MKLALFVAWIASDAGRAAVEGTAAKGISIAVTGMLIVACALTLICLFIAWLPKILGFVEQFWPESEGHHGASVQKTHPESLVPDDEAVLAAIGYVLHLRETTDASAKSNS